MNLQNKLVFITDADSSSGKAIISRLSQYGANFILNSCSGGKALSSEIQLVQEAKLKAIVVNINLCSGKEVEEMLFQAESTVGTVDVLIHNNKEIHQSSIEFGEEELFGIVYPLTPNQPLFARRLLASK